MIFTIQNLKKFLYSIKNRKVNYIKIGSNQVNIVINKTKKNNTNYSAAILNKNYYLQNQKKETSNQNHHSPKYSIKNTTNNQTIDKNVIKENESETYSTIISPMVGTFYRSPAPNELPFIEKKDLVQKKQTVCIIEAMKLMNEIESEVNGEIIEILVNDGDIVDCGQALIKVKIL
uniref:Biotin carboxyl carrier protein of acetyl-CoA carboxylase n=1 Tax=Dasya binghamiae TaxID=1896963 RepID=A0A1C8XS37_9FLOR|nr:acetyl-CoA carboxylase biotin carboxyl carrier protein [Dasya binghamiae]AOH77308.1 acetyl-CoA carboxylase biotin carboxyl carrier protein [Dasya binghamiae]